MVALCIFATSVYAQVSPKKFKKAKGIEVTYQSSYKGKVRPGEMIMKVSGDQVALESVMPKFDRKPADDGRPEYKLPVTKSYMDYAANEYYRWAELPSGEIISSASRARRRKRCSPGCVRDPRASSRVETGVSGTS